MDEQSPIQRFAGDHLERALRSLRRLYPSAVGRLDSAAELLLWRGVDDPRTFQQVGLLCRDALIEMIDTVYGHEDKTEHIPADKTLDRLNATLSYFEDRAASDDARRLLRAMAAYHMNVHHDRVSDEPSAERCLFLTVTLLAEISSMVRAVAESDWMVMSYGIFRCPACRSRNLDLLEQWDASEDGPYLIGREVYCTECDWKKQIPA